MKTQDCVCLLITWTQNALVDLLKDKAEEGTCLVTDDGFLGISAIGEGLEVERFGQKVAGHNATGLFRGVYELETEGQTPSDYIAICTMVAVSHVPFHDDKHHRAKINVTRVKKVSKSTPK